MLEQISIVMKKSCKLFDPQNEKYMQISLTIDFVEKKRFLTIKTNIVEFNDYRSKRKITTL